MQPNLKFQKIIQGDIAQLDQLFQAAAAPSPATGLRTATAERLCGFLLKNDLYDNAFAASITSLQQALGSRIAQDDSFYCQPTHPLRQALQLIISRSRIWYSRDTKTSQQYSEKLTVFMRACESDDLPGLDTARTELQRWFENEDKRAAMLEARLCETEINHFKMLSAETQILDFINSALAYKYFPRELNSGIASILKTELLHAYFTAGIDNPFWKRWQRLLPALGKMFATASAQTQTEEDEQILYRTIPALLDELELSLTLHTSNLDNYRHWVESLSGYLMLAIKKQPIHCEAYTALPYPEGYAQINTRVTADVLQQTNSLQEGDWILFSGEHGQDIRCKLALKRADLDQLLFVDNTGRKVMHKSVKDFSVCLSTGIARKLMAVDLEDTINKIIQALLDLHQQKQAQLQLERDAQYSKQVADAEQQRLTAEKLQQQDAQRQQEIEAEAKRQLIEQLAQRQAAAQKALAEAAALAEERARSAAALQLEQERIRLQLEAEQAAEHLQRIHLANIHISALNLGARVEIIINNEPVRCKLAVIIAATGKYIFVDNLGRKVAELQREQLVQALIDKQLTLLNNGDSFDDQLVKVIRGLRKDIS